METSESPVSIGGGVDISGEAMSSGMGNMNMSFMVNFDDFAAIHKADSSASVNSSINNTALNSKKRSATDAGNDSNKKRFVWPDALHRDFMGAVFDVGLQFANPKEVLALMGPSDPALSQEKLVAGIQKFNLFRERRPGEYVSFTDIARNTVSRSPRSEATIAEQHSISLQGAPQAVVPNLGFIRSENSSNSLNGHFLDQSVNPSPREKREPRPSPTATAALLQQIDVMGDAITAQSVHINNLKSLLKKQIKLHGELMQKANELRILMPNSDNKRHYNAFVDRNIRNTCGTLYKMNIVTGDSRYGLSFIDATADQNIYNDSYNYNYSTSSSSAGGGGGVGSAGEDGITQLALMRVAAGALAADGLPLSHPGSAAAAAAVGAAAGAAATTTGSSGGSSSSNRNGVQYMYEMRTHMDTHRRLLLQKEDQLSLHNCSTYIPAAYSSEDSCNSGYNSFMDHHKYNGYKYTAEDNRLCYADSKRYSSSSYGTESNTVPEPSERSYSIGDIATTAAGTSTGESSASAGIHRVPGAGASAGMVGVDEGATIGGSSSSSQRITPENTHLRNVHTSSIQHNNGSGAGGGSNGGGSGGSSSGGGGSMGFGGGMGINPITGMAEYTLEPDLEMDLFSFLMEPGPGE